MGHKPAYLNFKLKYASVLLALGSRASCLEGLIRKDYKAMYACTTCSTQTIDQPTEISTTGFVGQTACTMT